MMIEIDRSILSHIQWAWKISEKYEFSEVKKELSKYIMTNVDITGHKHSLI